MKQHKPNTKVVKTFGTSFSARTNNKLTQIQKTHNMA